MWLKWGDRNTKYFHATTIQRQQRNKISMLQLPNDEWCRDTGKLKEATVQFFSDLYSTVGSRNFYPVLDQCPSLVQKEMNEVLIGKVTLQEIKDVVFQLEAIKAPGLDGLNGQFFRHH